MLGCCVCKNLLKIGQLYLLLFPCLKVRLLICLFQSNLHSSKDKLSHMLAPLNTTQVKAPLTMLLLQWLRADSLHVFFEKTTLCLYMLKDFQGYIASIRRSLSLGSFTPRLLLLPYSCCYISVEIYFTHVVTFMWRYILHC